VVLAPENPPG